MSARLLLCVQVKVLFQKSPFLYRENDSVSIMNGVDEGTTDQCRRAKFLLRTWGSRASVVVLETGLGPKTCGNHPQNPAPLL